MFSDIGSIITDIEDVFDAVTDFFEFMLDPNSYVRIFEVLFGLLLIWGALHFGHS
jgi:hypothetical protein